MVLRGLLIFLLALGLLPSVCLGFSTPDVALDDPVYRDIDRLVAAGLVKAIIVGQRPYSRLEVARILTEAEEAYERLEDERALSEPLASTMGKILARMRRRFAAQRQALQEGGVPPLIGVHPLDEIRIDYEYTNREPARFTADNGLGSVEGARIAPFAYYRQGRQLERGSQFAVETVSSLRVTRYFSFLVEPRFYFPRQSDFDAKADLLQLYGRFQAGKASFSFGRKTVLWGQGEFAGALLSNNVWPLDLVMLASDQPSLLPSFLSYLGPAKGAFFYADLGDSYRRHPHAYLVGLKLSCEPHPNLELGITNLVISGGEGAPEAGFGERVRDVFSFDTDKPLSNRLGGLDVRLRLPWLRGANFYLELMFDDPNANFEVLFGDETAYLVGIYLPIVDPAGRLSLRAEYHRTGLRFYRHPEFPAVRRGDILGDPLGPDAQAGYLTGVCDITDNLELRLDLAAEFRSSDSYRITDPDEFTKEVVRSGPRERRYRVLAGLACGVLDGVRLEGVFGYEKVSNFSFEEGNTRDNYYSRLGLSYSFDYGSYW